MSFVVFHFLSSSRQGSCTNDNQNKVDQMVGWVHVPTAETQDLIFRLSFLVVFTTSADHSTLLIPSPCILLPTPLFPYILLPLLISLSIDSIHPRSVGLVPPSFCARLTRKEIILKNAQGGTFDDINIEPCQTSRNACGQQPSCKCPAGVLRCTVPFALRRVWTQASF